MVDINLNLLPGVAEKERRLRERRKSMILTGLIIGGNALALFFTLFLSFHSLSLGNNLKELNNKITEVQSQIEQYITLENQAKDLKIRISSIGQIKKKQVHWETILEALGSYTLKTIQYTDLVLGKEKITINGITPSLLDLEKNKTALMTAVITSNYVITASDTWEKIAQKQGFSTEAFLKLHNINGDIAPQADKTIKIKKPIFADVQIIKMQQPTSQKGNEQLTFSLEIILEKGMVPA